MSGIKRGVVKWFNDAKGFGFIEHDSGKDVFVHYSVIESDGFKTLKDGEEVEYELKEGDKGLHAARVVRVNAPARPTKSSDTSAGDQLSNGPISNGLAHALIAPNLETGSVSLTSKTSAEMLEVEVDKGAEEDPMYDRDDSSPASQVKPIS